MLSNSGQGLGDLTRMRYGVKSIKTDNRFLMLDASGKNGITFSKKRRYGDKEKRRKSVERFLIKKGDTMFIYLLICLMKSLSSI